jgi:ferric enterobactin receptor
MSAWIRPDNGRLTKSLFIVSKIPYIFYFMDNKIKFVKASLFFFAVVLCIQELVSAAAETNQSSEIAPDSLTVKPEQKAVADDSSVPATTETSQVHPVVPQKRQLAGKVEELPEMQVVAGRVNKLLKTSEKIGRIELSPELASKLPNVGQADLFRTLQLLPGVNGTNEASSGLFVQGGTPDQNLILLDQVPIYYVDHFYGFFSAFNPRAIEKVTLYKGGFGSQWGGRLSSVVDMSSKGKDMGSDTGGTAGLGFGLLSSDAFLQIPLDKNRTGTLMIAGRRAMSDVFKTDLFNRLFRRMHGADSLYSYSTMGSLKYQPKFFFWDLNSLASFKLGSHGKLTTTFFESYDNQDNSLDTAWATTNIYPIIKLKDTTTNNPKDQFLDTIGFDSITTKSVIKYKSPTSWGNLCVGQGWEQIWSDAFKTRLSLSYSQFMDERSEDNFHGDSTFNRYWDTIKLNDTSFKATSEMSSKNKIVDISGRFDNSLQLSDWNTLNAGVEISHKAVTYERTMTQSDTTRNEKNQGMHRYVLWPRLRPVSTYDTSVSGAIYAEDEMKFDDKAGLTPGLRLYWFRLTSAFAADPRLSGWWKPFPALTLKAAWGIYTQEMHRAEEEDIMGGSKFVWLLSTPNRPLEKSQQVIGGASWENPYFRLDAECYIKRLSGLLTISERMVSTIDPFDPEKLALFKGTGFARGLDILAQIKNVRFPLFSKNTTYDGWAAYTWSRTENTYAVFNNGNPFPATQDHPHEIKLVSSLEWDVSNWSSIDLSAVWLYSTGTPYTAPLGEYFFMLPDSMTRSYSYVSNKNVYRLPDYHRLDLSAAWKIRFGTHVEGRLTLGVFNAYNHENIIERTYTKNNFYSFGAFKPDGSGTQTTIFLPIDRKAMSITPNAAMEITARF